MSHHFLSAIILAAGASTRMGRPKQLLPLDGKPLLQHVIDAARAACLDEVIVVLGAHAEEIRAALEAVGATGRSPLPRIVVNPDHADGQSTSLRCGLRAADPRAAAAAILLGDQPAIRTAVIDEVARALLAATVPIVRPVYRAPDGARVPGHPAFLSRRIWPAVEQLCGDEGARALMRAHPEWLHEVLVDEPPPADLDTPDDYQRALRP
jgi:molybdenum cofactor cytidylyltransferase